MFATTRLIKLMPLYSREFQHYPLQNPLMITTERQSLNILRRLNGCCLFCPQPVHRYDLAICFNREVWVLYSQSQTQLTALQLAQAVQQSGAAEIVLIQLEG